MSWARELCGVIWYDVDFLPDSIPPPLFIESINLIDASKLSISYRFYK